VAGDVPTATKINDEILSNLDWLGAIKVGDTALSGLAAAYSIGGGWCAVNASSQDTAGAYVKVNFATERFDTFAAYNTGTSRFTVTDAGLYLVGCKWACDAGEAMSQVAIYKNGSSWLTNGPSGSYSSGFIMTIMSLAVSDYVEIWANGGASQTLTSGVCEFWGAKVG
jgi:hypothetical protein